MIRLCDNFKNKVKVARYIVTFRNRIVALDDLDEFLIVFRMVKTDIDKGGQLSSQKLVVDKYGMLFDNARAFKLFDAFNNG